MRSLGKLAPRLDPRTLRLTSYLRSVPAAPPARDWADALPSDLGLYQNDRIGCCTCAAAAHLQQAWTSQHGLLIKPSVDEVIDAYAAVSGYNGQEGTDRGADMLAVLNYWRRTGIAGNRIRAYVKLDHDDRDQLEVAANLFGGLYVGASLPARIVDKAPTWPWDVDGPLTGPDAVGSWGGHAMAVIGYNRSGVWLATWGRRQFATWRWFLAYVDEAYAVLDESWTGEGLVSPSGFDIEQLGRDLAAVGAA